MLCFFNSFCFVLLHFIYCTLIFLYDLNNRPNNDDDDDDDDDAKA